MMEQYGMIEQIRVAELIGIGVACFFVGAFLMFVWKQRISSQRRALTERLAEIRAEKESLEQGISSLREELSMTRQWQVRHETLDGQYSEVKDQHAKITEAKALLQHDLSAEEKKSALLEQEKEALAKERTELKQRNQELSEENKQLNSRLGDEENKNTRLASQLKSTEDRVAFLERAERQLGDTFAALASKALDDNTRKFLDNAQDKAEQNQKAVSDLVKPLQDSLQKLESQTENLAKERRDNQSRLEQEIKNLLDFSGKAQEEVRKLSRAFSQSQVRGQWGEYVLEQILKFSGLQENTHYDKQVTLQIEDGKQRVRPDYIIKLPNGRKLVIDAKTSFQAFEDAAMAEDENERSSLLKRHAEQVRENLDRLAKTDYLPFIQETYGENASPEYVIMFLPSEALYQAALEQLPKLTQEGFQKRVILTSPTTLFALIGVIQLGFRENALAAEAAEIGNRGKELYKRTSTLVEHISKIGGGIQTAVTSYNNAVGSLKRRFIPEAERFGRMESIRGEDFPELHAVNDSLRHDDIHQVKLLTTHSGQNREDHSDEVLD
ncbi:MAG: DNA recombination protein RmuC [Anaerolineaceae bacterium]|nr:DNA recombination protein RmuC [Anaerolineaceae bacterium]